MEYKGSIYVDSWQHTEGAISFTQPESQTDRSAFDLSKGYKNFIQQTL